VTPEERLAQVEHIVVLMMENRSFDHMLGYLTQDGMPEVRGLAGDEFNLDEVGGRHPVHAFDASATKVQRQGEALQKRLDPCHSPECVQQQVGTDNDGFVKSYVATREPGFPPELWNVPMGYYTGKDLPTYDHLARSYCVIDAWHAAIPGDTWPNRLYSIAGREAKSVWHESALMRALTHLPFLKKMRTLPLYDLKAFTRHLDPGDWRWYAHDPATLRAIDPDYRKFHDLRHDNFAWFDRNQVSARTLHLEEDGIALVAKDSFLDDAVNGQLRKVSWIDPNFIDVSVRDPNSNDDHPPSDILAGQQFVFDVYDALRNSPNWDDTLLVVAYDEHGGFYDHVRPPAVSDDSGYDTLGVRVPALVVGPRVKKKLVCHEAPDNEAWEHTALIRSIFLAFLDDPQAAIDAMGGRVKERKAHLGLVLEDEPGDIPEEASAPEERLREWRDAAREARGAAGPGRPSVAPDGAGQPFLLTDFQEEWAQFTIAMREGGLRSGT
jgi:phospholipase C